MEEHFDDLFDDACQKTKPGADAVHRKWIVMKVPKKKSVPGELASKSAFIYEWSSGHKSLVVGDVMYDVIDNQDTREIYGLVDSTSGIIHFGLDYRKAVLRPTFKALSTASFEDKKQSRIKITQEAFSKSKSSSASKSTALKKKHSYNEREGEDSELEGFLEDDSDDNDEDGIF
jgi:hypothetical protein